MKNFSKCKVKQRVCLYKLKHKDQYRLYNNKRMALKKAMTVEDFAFDDIIEKYGSKCVYCGGKFEHIDHYVPLSKGGEHTLDNVRPSCANCNLKKNNKMPEDFLNKR
jgi:5-methylcytosine-specific restriction endonuclease McrA